MLKFEKKQVKWITLAIVAVFVVGIAGLAVSQSGGFSVASAASSSNVGVVNYQYIVSQHPDMAKAQQTMQQEAKQAKQDFDSKSAGMSDKAKQEYMMQLQQRLSAKEKELLNPILEKVEAAIKGVAESKGLSVVLDKSNVVYGGTDITDAVVKKMSGK